jgi:ParB-like chromosome segregation protein Spo0J
LSELSSVETHAAATSEGAGAPKASGSSSAPPSPESVAAHGVAVPKKDAAGPLGVPAEASAPALSELLRRGQRPGELALLRLEQVDADTSMKLRDEGDIDSLATSIAKLGQLFPVELRQLPLERFQVITGFRRIAALRLLHRERVLARVHADLSDEDALRLALADLLEGRGADREELTALRGRLEEQGRLTGSVQEALQRAIAPAGDVLGPETLEPPEEEVDLEELTEDVLARLAAVNQDLALIAELWHALDPGLRDALLEQLGYPQQLVTYLRGR